ncbi:MAG: hypothetical protein WC891_08665 [Actinomycetota bacterium]
MGVRKFDSQGRWTAAVYDLLTIILDDEAVYHPLRMPESIAGTFGNPLNWGHAALSINLEGLDCDPHDLFSRGEIAAKDPLV